MQPSESRSGKDATRGYRANSAVRCSLLESEMRAVVMIVADIISEQSPPVAAVQSDHLIQQVTPAAINPTLRNSILPRTPQRSADTFDFHRPDRGGDLRPILGVMIEDDEPRSRPQWKRLSQSLDDPYTRRMPGDVDVQYVRSETSKPSMSGSPWMRGAPHVGFSTTIRKIKSRTSCEILLLPAGFRTREIKRQ